MRRLKEESKMIRGSEYLRRRKKLPTNAKKGIIKDDERKRKKCMPMI